MTDYTEDDVRLPVAAVRALLGVYDAWQNVATYDPGRELVSDGTRVGGIVGLLSFDDDKAMDEASGAVQPHLPIIRAALAGAGRLLPEDTRRARELPAGNIVANDTKVWIKRMAPIDGPYWIGAGAYQVQTTDDVIDRALRDGARVLRVGSWVPVPDQRGDSA